MTFLKPATFTTARRTTGLFLAAITALVLGGCAPATRVILLPQSDGSRSAVVVTSNKGSQVVGAPYQVAEVQRNGAMALARTDETEVEKAYPRLIAMQPAAQELFVLQFEPGSSTLTAESHARLPAVIEAALSRAGGEIIVTGHTDRQGSLEANDALSLERARAIRAMLIEWGFKPELIEAVGRGERSPLVPTDDEVEEPRNRRAEVVVR
ncbi:MAG: OmpA family protein [Burkholderiaceae bacterium]